MSSDPRFGITIVADGSAARATIEDISGSIRRVEQAAGAGAQAAHGLTAALARIGHYGAGGGAIFALAGTIKTTAASLFEASAGAERLRSQLNFATGNAGREMEYLRTLASRLGVEFGSVARAYAGFASAARGTSLQGEQAKAAFEAIAKASTVMGLSAHQTEGALLAVQQMMAKGVVSAEEFRGQLGERMPIALQAGAQAIGKTTAEFTKLLETGQPLAARR